MSTFREFMAHREAMILAGGMAHDSDKAREHYLNDANTQQNTHVKALTMAEADRSDPFTYNRIVSRCMSGTDHHEDWETKFGSFTHHGRDLGMTVNDDGTVYLREPESIKYKVQVPHNASRP